MRNERRRPRTGGRSSIRASTSPRSRPRYANTAMPALCGRSSRDAGRSVASFRPPRRRDSRSPSPPSRSVTSPRLTRRSSSRRIAPCRRTASARASSRRTIRPRMRRTTITPTRSLTRTWRTPSGRVVRSMSAAWSPGAVRREGVARTWRMPFAPGAMRIRFGRIRSHAAVPPAGRTRGFPRSERAKPPREASTSRVRRPGFRTVTAADVAPLRVRRSGVALSPMPRPAAAPGMDAAAAPRASARSARLTCRSP